MLFEILTLSITIILGQVVSIIADKTIVLTEFWLTNYVLYFIKDKL